MFPRCIPVLHDRAVHPLGRWRGESGLGGPFMKIARVFMRALTIGVTASPEFVFYPPHKINRIRMVPEIIIQGI